MQQQQPAACSRCGYASTDNYCTRCGVRQPGRRSSSNSAPFPWKPVLAVLAVVIVLIVVILIVLQQSGEPPDPYQDGLRTPSQVLQDIKDINSYVTLKCIDTHLNDWEWICPRVSEEQAALIISRLMANLIMHVARMVDPNIPEEETTILSTKIGQTVLAMNHTTCLPRTQAKLDDVFLEALERVEFIQQCHGGWTLSGPWHEVISRQSPQPTPDWTFYQRHLPPEMRP